MSSESLLHTDDHLAGNKTCPDRYDEDDNLSRCGFRPWRSILALQLAIFVASLTFSVSWFWMSTKNRTCQIDEPHIASPLWEAVRYQEHHLDVDLFRPSVFKGEPRPELNAAWEGVVNTTLILVDEQDLQNIGERTDNAHGIVTATGEKKYFAMVGVAHQLHCVDLIRKFIWRDHYPEYAAFQNDESTIREHVDHCIDFVRQTIQCSGDVGIMAYTDRGKDQTPEARVSNQRVCRDFGAIQKWTFDHAWDKYV